MWCNKYKGRETFIRGDREGTGERNEIAWKETEEGGRWAGVEIDTWWRDREQDRRDRDMKVEGKKRQSEGQKDAVRKNVR